MMKKSFCLDCNFVIFNFLFILRHRISLISLILQILVYCIYFFMRIQQTVSTNTNYNVFMMNNDMMQKNKKEME